jgi:hypothetical protein
MTSRPASPLAPLLAVGLAAVLGGCVAGPQPPAASASPAASGASWSGESSAGATADLPTGEPSAAPSLDRAGLDQATANAIQFRLGNGLRADLDYVRLVMADPTATSEFGTPLLPAEVRELFARNERADAIIPVVNEYAAANRAVFGGAWIDQAAGGLVTVSFTDDLLRHRLALADLLGTRGVVRVVQARYAESVMRALQERITADSDWFTTIPARLQGVGYGAISNAVEIDISTANPDVASLIAARFGVPADALVVRSDGTGIALEPWGTITGRVVDVPAKALVELSINYHGDRVGADCGSEVGLGLTPAGTFELPCQGGHWVIEAGRTIEDIVARGEVDLAPGGTATVTLRPVAP